MAMAPMSFERSRREEAGSDAIVRLAKESFRGRERLEEAHAASWLLQELLLMSVPRSCGLSSTKQVHARTHHFGGLAPLGSPNLDDPSGATPWVTITLFTLRRSARPLEAHRRRFHQCDRV